MAPSHWLRMCFLLCLLLTSSLAAQSQTAALQFVPVTPCRVADTRWAPGTFGGPAMDARSSRGFPVPQQSACGIPANAAAFALNVTVVPRGRLGYLTIWPAGQERPVASTLNSYDGRVKANAAIVPAGRDGSVSVYVTDLTDVILDIDGYFVPATATTLAFFPLMPCRVADTRREPGPLGGPYLHAHQEREFPLLASACNIPDEARAYSLNMTVLPRTSAGLGYLTVWPTSPGSQPPNVSTLNAPNTAVANAAIVPGGVEGAISAYVTHDTELIIDINGYFAASGPEPLSLFSLAPCRVLDTRPPNGSGSFSGALPINVLGSTCHVPAARAYIFNATVVPAQGPMGYLSLWPDAEGQPVVSTLNARDGKVTSNMAIVPTVNGAVDAYAFDPTNLIMDIFGYFAPIQPLVVTTQALPAGTVNYTYRTTLSAAGGVLPYTWSLEGDLPPGLNLDPSGTISGTPTVTGIYNFGIEVTDSETSSVTATAPLSITVNNTLSRLSITTPSLPNGSQNSTYSATVAATGGVMPYTWTVVSGRLPAGLTLNPSTGAITGIPTGGGQYNFTVKVTDSETSPQIATAGLSIIISPAVPLSMTTTTLRNGTAGQQYSVQLVAIGGVYPYNWNITAGSLPAGLTLYNDTGVISGVPTLGGTSEFTIKVTDAETPPISATAQLSITIEPPLRVFTVLHSFTGPDGAHPAAPLVLGADGNLWGTTYYGGASNDFGTVFKITPGGVLSTVFPFSSPTYHGSNPMGMVRASDGNFYGATYNGGRGSMGTIFRLTPSSFDLLYSFCGQSNCVDGRNPAYLMQASDGNFYGMNAVGGNRESGDFYQLKPNGTLSVLYSFNPATTGSGTFVSLVQGRDGQLYGTAPQGGAHDGGTVFKIALNGTLTLLHSFCSIENCADGAHPYAGLTLGSDGNFYGTTSEGGPIGGGAGTVFKITPGGQLTTIYAFAGPDGAQPRGGLVQGIDGNFYGTTYEGGAWGVGTIFEVTPSGTLTTLHSFNGADGINPAVSLLSVASGYLYGTTSEGGASNRGTVFSLSPPSR